MGVFTFEIVSLTVVLAALFGWYAYNKSAAKALRMARRHSTAVQVTTWTRPDEQWGMQFDCSSEDRACAVAQTMLGRRFPMAEAPQLPLKDCPYPRQCECHYRRLADQRIAERRSGKDRRVAGDRAGEGKPNRRSGKDRRQAKSSRRH